MLFLSFGADRRFILETTSLGEGISLEQEDSHRSHVSSGGSSEDIAKRHFAKLTVAEFEAVAEFYRHDFQAFEYDPMEFNPDVLKSK